MNTEAFLSEEIYQERLEPPEQVFLVAFLQGQMQMSMA